MSSAARALANQANSKKSTGPKTPEGKAQSARNAVKHGLASAAVVLPYESMEDYEALKVTFEETHQPGSDLEIELLHNAVNCYWRYQRAQRVEAEFFLQREHAIRERDSDLEGDSALASMFSDPTESPKFRLFMRYFTAAERAWNKALADFEKVKKARLKEEALQERLKLAHFERMLNRPFRTPPVMMGPNGPIGFVPKPATEELGDLTSDTAKAASSETR